MTLKVKIEGLDDLKRNFEKLERKTKKKHLRKALRAGAKPIRDEAKRRAPRRTSPPARTEGKPLHRTVKVRAAPRQKGMDLALQVTTAGHGIFLEFGTVHIAPQPFLRPAFDQQKDASISEFRKKLSDLLRAGP